jgi:ribulose-5-phosphate 4-epimerase/fuculose-1-phosphate aldolase
VLRARVDLAAAFRAAALNGYDEGIDNHFSLVQPDRTDRFFLNRHGLHWSELSASDLLTVDVDGQVVDGDGEYETTAFAIHRAVHLVGPWNRCVLHAHMPYATAVSALASGFDTSLSQNAMYYEGRIASVDYGGLAIGNEEGERIAAAAEQGIAVVILRNHGVLVVGSDVAAAWQNLYYFERACQVQILAQSTGQPLAKPGAEAVARARAVADDDGVSAALLFAAVKRQLSRESPGYEA